MTTRPLRPAALAAITVLALFAVVALLPPFPDALDPAGGQVTLGRDGQLALGLFLLAATWWIFEVIPIGATAIAIFFVPMFFLVLEKLGKKRSSSEAAGAPGDEHGAGGGGALQPQAPQAPTGKPGNE